MGLTLRGLATFGGWCATLVALWALAVALFEPPRFLLPSPLAVAQVFGTRTSLLLESTAITATEIVLGLLVGSLAGIATAFAVTAFRTLRGVVQPLMIVSQALPVFAIAPLLVVWLGYGITPKIVMASLIIYFPVASAYADGMARTDPALIDLARLYRAGPVATLLLVRAPAGVPSLIAGLRVATSIAPIGAVVGEWVGASAGLGALMLQANARLETDLLFAALVCLAVLTLALRAIADQLLARAAPWAPERPAATDPRHD